MSDNRKTYSVRSGVGGYRGVYAKRAALRVGSSDFYSGNCLFIREIKEKQDR